MYSLYLQSIEEHLQRDIVDFKRDPRYRIILEHVSKEQGQEYLNECIKKISKEFLSSFCEINDSIGNPEKFKYEDFIETSPTSLRYAFQAISIFEYIERNKKLDSIDFIIIGDGYGGLNIALQYFSTFFNIKIRDINVIDLKQPIDLQKKYIEKLEYNYANINFIKYDDINKLEELNEDCFLIANYSLSEFSKDIFKEYLNYIKKFKHGYITWNGKPYGNDYKELLENKENVDIKSEYPLTSPDNEIITFNSFSS